jgi:hypothetical protein
MTKARIRRVPHKTDGSCYLHPNGYVLERHRRTWSERTGRMQGTGPPPPLWWWTATHHIA